MKNKRLLKNTVIIGIGTFCTKLLSFIMLPLYTRWLSPESFGEYDLLVSYLSLFIPIITLELEQTIFKWSLEKKENSKQLLFNSMIVTLINIIIVDIIAFLILKKVKYTYAFILYFDFYAIFVLLSEYLRGNDKLKFYSIYNILVSIISTILSVVFVPILKMDILGLILAFAISYLICDLVIIKKEKILINSEKLKYNGQLLKSMISFSVPLIPNGISWWITNVSDRTMIKILIGSFYNGLYAVACKIPTIISLVYNVFNLSWQQQAIMINGEENKYEYYKDVFSKLINFLFSSSIVIIGLLPFFYRFFISVEYCNSIYVVIPLILGSIFLSLSQFLGGILLAENRTKEIGFTTSIAAIINILVNILLMKKFGLIVAGISTLISYVYFFLHRYIIIKKIANKSCTCKLIFFSIMYIIYSYFNILSQNLFINICCIIISGFIFIYLNRFIIDKLFTKLVKSK